jgi:hypothetical protein
VEERCIEMCTENDKTIERTCRNDCSAVQMFDRCDIVLFNEHKAIKAAGQRT